MFPLLELDFLGTDAATRWGAIAVGVLTLLYIAFIRPLRNAKKKDPMERAAHGPSALAQQRAIERDMSNLLVEYEQMIRQMTAGLDTRAAKLELLIREAEGMIATLQSATATAAAAAPSTGTGSPVLPPPAEGVAPALPAPPQPDVVQRAAAATGPDPRYAEVYGLADDGHPPREIARRLGRPHGEIELILALRSDAR